MSPPDFIGGDKDYWVGQPHDCWCVGSLCCQTISAHIISAVQVLHVVFLKINFYGHLEFEKFYQSMCLIMHDIVTCKIFKESLDIPVSLTFSDNFPASSYITAILHSFPLISPNTHIFSPIILQEEECNTDWQANWHPSPNEPPSNVLAPTSGGFWPTGLSNLQHQASIVTIWPKGYLTSEAISGLAGSLCNVDELL